MSGAVELAGADTLTRLGASSARVAALQSALAAEVELRDALITAGRDENRSWRDIGRAARLSPSRCVAIVGGG